jgi:NTE family protein
MQSSSWRRIAVGLLSICTALAASGTQSSVVVGQQGGGAVTSEPAPRRAVVLGGGNALGGAWELGVLKGLRDAGVDLTEADLFVGSSAGSRVATWLRAGRDVDELYAQALAPSPRVDGAAGQSPEDSGVTQEITQMWQSPGVERTVALRIQIGARALAANGAPEEETLRSAAGALRVSDWPDLPLRIAAVDVYDGTVRFFDPTQGVPIARAVAASRAVPGLDAPITVGQRRYMDGSVAGENLEGAIGYNVVIAIIPERRGPSSSGEIERYRNYHGGDVVQITPAADSPVMTGAGVTAPAAEAGLRYAATVLDEVRDAWYRGRLTPTS